MCVQYKDYCNADWLDVAKWLFVLKTDSLYALQVALLYTSDKQH